MSNKLLPQVSAVFDWVGKEKGSLPKKCHSHQSISNGGNSALPNICLFKVLSFQIISVVLLSVINSGNILS